MNAGASADPPAAAFVSRGGQKLDGALQALGVDVAGLRALDAGASTGGFTDCLLRRGAVHVVAVDVAYGQLAWTLRNDERVTVMERSNIRHLQASDIGDPVDLVVADLSFISLRTVKDAVSDLTAPNGSLVLMVKPQFELPRDQVPAGGVVNDPALWRRAVADVVNGYRDAGFFLAGAAASPITGPKGNREFFVHLVRAGHDAGDSVIDEAIRLAP